MSNESLERLSYYELRHLVAHLAAEGRAQDLDRLFALETVEGRNAWHERKYAIGDVAGYLEDINEAWGLPGYGPNPRHTAALRDLRYALIAASLNSLSQSTSAGLTLAAVEKGIWGLEQGLTYARRCPDPKQRVEMLMLLAPECAPELQRRVFLEAITAWSAIEIYSDRAPKLLALTDSLPDELKPKLICEGLRIADELKPSEIKRLFEAAPVECRDELIPALLRTAEVVDDERRVMILSLLAPLLTSELWPKVLKEVVVRIKGRSQLNHATDLLAKYLSADTLGVVLSWGYSVGEWINYTWVGAFAPYVNKQALREVLEAAGECMAKERTSVDDYKALIEIARHLDEETFNRAHDIAQDLQDGKQRVALLRALNQAMCREKSGKSQEVSDTPRSFGTYDVRLSHDQQDSLDTQTSLAKLQEVAETEDESERYTKLRQLLPRLSRNVLPDLVHSLPNLLTRLPRDELDLLSHIVSRLNDGERGRALSRLTPLLSRIPSGGSDLNETLDRLAPHLSEAALRETLVLARQVRDAKAQNDAMIALLPYLSTEMKDHVLRLSLKQFDEAPLHFKLPEVIPHLTQNQIEELLHRILSLPHGSGIASEEQLVVIAIGTPSGCQRVFEKLLDLGRNFGTFRRTKLFRALIPKVKGQARNEAIESWLATGPSIIDGGGLNTVTRYLTKAHLRQLINMANQVKTGFMRANRLGTLAAYLPMDLIGEALELAQDIEEEEYKFKALAELKAKALARFSERLPEAKRQVLVKEILSLVRESARADVLEDIMCILARDQKREAMAIVNSLRDSDHQLSVLIKVARFLDQELATEALYQVRQCHAESYLRIPALVNLLPLVPETLRDKATEEAAEKTLTVSDAWAFEDQVEDLWKFAQHISTEQLRRLVIGAQERHISANILVEGYQALAKRLSPDEATQFRSAAVALVHTMDSPYSRKKALEHLAIFDEAQRAQWLLEILTSEPEHGVATELNTEQLILEMEALPGAVRLRIWNDVLRRLETMSRPELFKRLRRLLPLLRTFSGTNWAEGALKEIEDVARWWH